ncbi:MAG: transglycosylase family protein [Actinomycetota bacterium]
MAEVRPARSRVFVATLVVLMSLLAALVAASPAGSQSGIRLGVDVTSFSQRAAAWSTANVVHRQAAIDRAEALGEQAAEAEAAAEARAEAEREAALAAARATTTAAPTTTVAPTTTSAPPTAAAPAVEPTTTEAAPTTVAPAPSGGPTAQQWAALRNCESGGRYDAVSPSGRYRGAYQFSRSTWDWVAGFANPALVGVDPAAASVVDQDAQAQALYDRNGAGPWPHCGTYLS